MKFSAITFLILFVVAGCADTSVPVNSIKGSTMGTSYSILWPSESQVVDLHALQANVDAVLDNITSQMSTYDHNSELSIFNAKQAPASQKISKEFADVMNLSTSLSGLTDGYFDVTVGPLVNSWGFGPDKLPSKIPSDQQLRKLLEGVGISEVSLDQGILSKRAQRYVDLSAVAKGYAVDAVAALLESHGIDSYLVEIGGEMKAAGFKAPDVNWKIAIETPDLVVRKVHKILAVKDIAIATSGDYRNYYELDGERYSHSIDPKTGSPVEHSLASVTILDETCARADALATAMLVMGFNKAKGFAEKNGVKAYLIVRNEQGKFEEYLSPAFAGWFNP